MPLDMRSSAPSVPGVPWWGALAIAAGATLIGLLIDAARGDELTSAFTAFYVLGCMAAVVAVRYRGLFTAMAQPPLLLVVAIPLGQELLASGSTMGLKDLALNVAYPLVNRFPAMLLATVVVLLIGGARIFAARQNPGVRARAPRERPRDRRSTRAARAGRAAVERGAPAQRQAPASRAKAVGSTPAESKTRAQRPPVESDVPPQQAPRAATSRRPREAAAPVASVKDVADTRGNPVARRRDGGSRREELPPHEPAPRRRPQPQEPRPPESRPTVTRQAPPAQAYPPPRVRYRDRYED
ncbi:hypothetical protein Q8814_19360 [Rhodococcus sp. CC-R104]|uniref:DUF6542 domain-containing protein n=1 Tax=Rhodococcus chondri TaxID=3065941 RepID=A0ABU7JW67_9NOCA|nr:hypothetical protein [Rhodococcus sp. CC-R104]